MFSHIISLIYVVRVGTPDPAFGNMLLGEFGDANGEIDAEMPFSIQRLNRDDAVEVDPLDAIAGASGVTLCNSMENPSSSDLLEVTGKLDVGLHSSIAAEARATNVYERLIKYTDNKGAKDALQFLMTREIIHMIGFIAALKSMGKDPIDIGLVSPTPGLVNQCFDDSTGPWNQANGITMIQEPAHPPCAP